MNCRWPHVLRISSGLVLILCGALTGNGCAKKEQAGTAPAAATNAPAQPAGMQAGNSVNPPPPIAAAPEGGADLRDLNHAYIRWVVQSHRHAKTFEEYVAASGVRVPPAPAGKKYIIDKAGFIALANQ